MNTPTKTTLLQSLGQVSRSPGAVSRFVNSLYSIFQVQTGTGTQQAQASPSIVMVGNKMRLRGTGDGGVIEVLGVDNNWHLHQQFREPSPT